MHVLFNLIPFPFIGEVNLSSGLTVLFFLCLLSVVGFEFVNGFHDTANAVATVIYTKALKPMVAVPWSGTFNFLGVMLGGVTVAVGVSLCQQPYLVWFVDRCRHRVHYVL